MTPYSLNFRTSADISFYIRCTEYVSWSLWALRLLSRMHSNFFFLLFFFFFPPRNVVFHFSFSLRWSDRAKRIVQMRENTNRQEYIRPIYKITRSRVISYYQLPFGKQRICALLTSLCLCRSIIFIELAFSWVMCKMRKHVFFVWVGDELKISVFFFCFNDGTIPNGDSKNNACVWTYEKFQD